MPFADSFENGKELDERTRAEQLVMFREFHSFIDKHQEAIGHMRDKKEAAESEADKNSSMLRWQETIRNMRNVDQQQVEGEHTTAQRKLNRWQPSLAKMRLGKNSVAAGTERAHSKKEMSTGRWRRRLRRAEKLADMTRHPDWIALRGTRFEERLMPDDSGHSAVALVDARFLVELARTPKAILLRRQDIPPDAFVSLTDLASWAAQKQDKHKLLRIVSVSYPWLQPDHPDPHGYHLGLVGQYCEAMLGDMDFQGCRVAVFWDFCSLYQKGVSRSHALLEPGKFVERSPVEIEYFKEALGEMQARAFSRFLFGTSSHSY